MIETVETVTGEAVALMEVLKLHAPGVKWTYALVGNFERALLKRGYVLYPMHTEATIPVDKP